MEGVGGTLFPVKSKTPTSNRVKTNGTRMTSNTGKTKKHSEPNMQGTRKKTLFVSGIVQILKQNIVRM